MKTPKVGDRVEYTRKFIKSAGVYLREARLLTGKVIKIVKFTNFTMATVMWDRDDDSNNGKIQQVNLENLQVIGA